MSVAAISLGWPGTSIAAQATTTSKPTTAVRVSAPAGQTALRRDVDVLRTRIDDQQQAQQQSSDNAQYFFQAVTIIIAVATLLIAIVAIAATLIGYQLVKRYIESEFTHRAGEAFDEHGVPLLEQRADEMMTKVDAKLADVDEQLSTEVAMFRAASGSL